MTERRSENKEMIALLKQIVSAVKQGHVIEVDGKPIAKAVRKEANGYFKRTGKAYFES